MSILAKSTGTHGEKRLDEHIEDDLIAFESMFGTREQPSRLAHQWLRFFGLGPEQYADFWTNGIAATGLHDLGKANNGFQDAVRNNGPQTLRHEHLSAFLLMTPALSEWLGCVPRIDSDLVASAVLGHHLKASQSELGSPSSEREVAVFEGECEEVIQLLDALSKSLGTPLPEVAFPRFWTFGRQGESIDDYAQRLSRRFQRVNRALRNDRGRHQLFMAVKAAVIVADSAGSGLAREVRPISAWLSNVFSDEQVVDGDYIEREVLSKRINQLVSDSLPDFTYHRFQDDAATMPPRTLMIAPCGAGKTLAAWRWIGAQLESSTRSRVIFLYPTRATATEGFRDYVAHAPEADASLLTGTAAYELRDMFDNPNEPREGVNYLTEARLYALGYWNKRLFSATVDQFLSFMQQSYKGLCLLPVLADAVIVFDEVHSFDVGLFDTFCKFLQSFEVPVLAMTASLPVGRRRALEGAGLHLFTGESLEDLTASAELPRYEVAELDDDAEAERTVRAAILAQEDVLWVVNTVDRAQSLAQRVSDLYPICYHSRFTLDDRKRRHAEVIRAFQRSTRGGRLAITTQVCEMSLDLDARMLVSELAPISSLIQRMGRCNRHGRPGHNKLGRVRFCRPDKDLPYAPEEMRLAERFVADIAGRQISQAQLEERLEHYTQGQGREADRWTAFLDDGAWAASRATDLRDTTDYTVQAVLDDRVDEFLHRQRAAEPTDGLIVRVPRASGAVDQRLPRYLRTAPADNYNPLLGFLKEPVKVTGGRQ